ncbi:MAG TPA: M20/M25/M40 family metallo-hydrolase, partial [Burkholderiaceae bacterium]
STLMATLEAVEATLRQGQAPRRTVLLAFGHDEELGGRQGAAAIAALLAQRGVKAQFSLDEGAFVLERFFPGVERPVAQIGLAEKGYLSLALEANAPGGHSSVPPPETAIGRIGRAVARIEANPLPPQLDGPGPQGLKALAPALPWPMRVALANDKLLGPVLVRALAARPATNAMMRTTAVPTMIQGGVKDNVLPSTASAVVNFRLAPGDTIAGVYAHVRGAIDDPAVRVSQYGASAAEATEIASLETAGGRALAEVIGRRVPGAIVIPGLVVGGTDTRHYGRVSNAPYRFTPLRLTPADVARFHGVDERISLANYAEMIAFQIDLIATATR